MLQSKEAVRLKAGQCVGSLGLAEVHLPSPPCRSGAATWLHRAWEPGVDEQRCYYWSRQLLQEA